MQTPWGDLPIADAHVHFFSRRFFELLSGQDAEIAGARLGWEVPGAAPEELARCWAAELDRHGVATAALIASVPGDEPSVAAAVAAFPERFHGWFMVNALAPGAPSDADRALGGGLRGICLFPAMHRFSIQDERVRPILEVAAGHRGTIVFVHCGVLTVGARKKLGLPSLFDMRYSNPIDLHAVALQFPQVHFVVPHFGAGYFREALILADLCANVCLDTSSTNSWVKYQPGPMNLEFVFRKALDVVGASRLLFGSDSSFFPRGWNRAIFDAQCEVLKQIGIGAADARLIFGENLSRLMEIQSAKGTGTILT